MTSIVQEAFRRLALERAEGEYLLRRKLVTWTPWRRRSTTSFITLLSGTRAEVQKELEATGSLLGVSVKRSHGRRVVAVDLVSQNVSFAYYMVKRRASC